MLVRDSLVVAVLLAFAAPAGAAVVPFTGSIQLEILDLPIPPIPGGGVATINGSGGISSPVTRLALPGAAFQTTISIPMPNQFPVVDVAISVANGPATFGSTAPACGTPHPNVTCSDSATLHGRSALHGIALVGLFGTTGAPFSNLTVPLSGVGGGSTVQNSSPLGITVHLSGAGWTTGTVMAFDPSPVATGTRTGGQTATASGGTIQLVSPFSMRTNAGGSIGGIEFATWRITYTGALPEPGTLLLLGSAALALAVRFRGRGRRFEPGSPPRGDTARHP